MQFFALFYTIPDSFRLQGEVEKARNAQTRLEIARFDLEKQVLELRKTTETRQISSATAEALIRDLATIPKGTIEILAFDKDPEAIYFGESLKTALVQAGCVVKLTPKSIYNLSILPSIAERQPDLVFCVKERESPPIHARVILNRLKSDGIDADGWPHNESFARGHLEILVCPKPRKPKLDEQLSNKRIEQ